ncbi:MAG TPA: carbamoyltransferase HypF [Acidobacteriaceae bacterium]|nr:carbamoyltransferase HypF [Acidobacteriaceae bacterium]
MATSRSLPRIRKRLSIRGVVQGVGFRPFVYNLAQSLQLAGFILNSSSGVTVEIEGPNQAIEQFLHSLHTSPPPLAQIIEIALEEISLQNASDFSIHPSREEEDAFAFISPDVATCTDCWHDFGDPANRRYGYAFTNCTNCGPRYTIIQDIPYDRPTTTMASFRMCALCQAEYENPANRRFHAQPNACPACGPSLVLAESRRHSRDSHLPAASDFLAAQRSSLTTLQRVRDLLHAGRLIAVKGLGGFLLACDAQDDAAVRQLRHRKHRSDKPFALMARDLAEVEKFCIVTEADRAALQSPRRPIVILERHPETNLSRSIAPGNDSIGVMLPYTPLHYLLFSDSPQDASQFAALVMTSGNLSEEPIVISNEEAWQQLEPVADWFLFHNRGIHMRADDSVVRTFDGRERVMRRSRGYVPQAIDLGAPMQDLLACGAELKHTFCLTKDHYAILSQHIGDLENFETLCFFQETLANLKKLFRAEPQGVAYDLHPNYRSTQFALSLPIERKIGVQHHHAHIASCMAENHLQGKVIGVAFDGTGYGTDGKIWGGEFLVADLETFERRAHLRYLPLPGGDAAVRQPWRMALSYVRDTFGNGSLPERLHFLHRVPQKQIAIVDAMIARRIQSIETSSSGRLFDAVAALVGLGSEVTFEGQAAIALESAAQPGVDDHYSFHLENVEPMQVDMRPMVEEIVRDLAHGTSVGLISARFHNTVAAAIIDVCRRIRQQEQLTRVCLSGGVFQNMHLLKHTVRDLDKDGFQVFLHALVPPNDGGISLGQAAIANAILRREQE